jgi:hypothetical protein
VCVCMSVAYMCVSEYHVICYARVRRGGQVKLCTMGTTHIIIYTVYAGFGVALNEVRPWTFVKRDLSGMFYCACT